VLLSRERLNSFIYLQVLGDVFEALLAVVFIDSGFNLDAVFAVLDRVYEDIVPWIECEDERRVSFRVAFLDVT